ncbi:DNA-binding response regulator [Cupriavidus basilensis]|uniref:DNA-binding response regulator n=1 Tax=Cupriavidus basilensis TaxID=68895 RepID=A0ABT6AR87_9BURK|nr:DNA-binding response regulator [Cupriavidus basilensis]MDF3834954.1 DNA-binding response regulator [Cupriavidus basilensis]
MTEIDQQRLPEPHVLLIDDNPDELRLLVEALRDSRCRISIAFDGMQGYDRAVAFAPDLILLDVRMPKMDGFAVTRMLKANAVTENIPVIFLTVSSEISARLTGLREGGVDYIVKPYAVEEVVERVRIHLKLSSRLAERTETKSILEDDTGAAENREQVLVRAARRYLSAKLSDPPTLPDLARALGVDKRRISSAFQRNLGVTVFEYIRLERMKKARHLLARTSLSIAAIAEEVGFTSTANFSTAFRDHMGVPPSAFRNNQR